jgi:PAS domain S-box-containing protein
MSKKVVKNQKDQRIKEIIRILKKMAAGEFSSRINVSNSKDEIDGITSGINLLSEKVVNMNNQLNRENNQLREVVKKLENTTTELNKNREIISNIFHSNPDSLTISRLDNGLFIDVNEGFCRLTGYTREEVIGKPVFELGLWTSKKEREKLVNELKEKKVISNHEIQFKRKDNRIRDTLLSAMVIHMDEIPHMLTITRDITELKEIQEELRISKERYEDLLKSAPDGIVVLDKKGVIILANDAFTRIGGYSADEVVGMHFAKFPGFRAKDIPRFVKLFAELQQGCVTEPIEIEWLDKNGFLHYSEMHTSLLKEKNKIIGIQAIVRDITEKVRFLEALKSSEKQYRTSLDSMQEWVHLVNRDMEIILANKSMIRICEKLGFTKDIVGKKFYELFPFLKKTVKDNYINVFETGKNIHKEEYFEINGIDYHTYTRLIPIYEEKRVERILTIIQDITERKKNEKIREIMYSISSAVTVTKDLNELFRVIQKELGKAFDTTNFFVALYNKKNDTLSLSYFIDEKDQFTEFPARKTLTGYMIRNDKPLLMKDEQIKQLVKSGEIEDVGTPSKIWLGVPLKIKDEIIGALVVQHYENENAYTEQDLEILKFVSTQISLSIETKKAYDDVQIEKAYFEQLFENSPETIILTDINGHLLKVNNEFEKLFGYSAKEALGKKIDDLIAPESLYQEATSISKRVGQGEKVIVETIRQDKKGNQIHVSILGTPIEIGGGQVGVYGIYRNISEQKKARLALEESEEKLRNILYSSPDAILLADLRGYITEGNPASLEIFGLSSMDELIGMNAIELVTPQKRKQSLEEFKKVLRKGYVKNVEFELLLKNKKRIFVEISASLIKDASGRPSGIVAVTKDITDRREYQKKLQLAKEKAEESDKLKSAFLANMSHEIRTPMNAILGFSELLKNKDLTDEERNEYIKIIRGKGNELLLIINDIIDISKIEAGDIRMISSTFPVNEFMLEIFQQYNEEKSMMNKDHVQFRLTISEDKEPFINTDRIRLKQIFTNLVQNAFKFTFEGYVKIGYKIQNNRQIKFFIKDTGIGIPKKKQDLIFDRFRQVDESLSSQFGGTGLGLAISKNLIDLLGSKIAVHSHPAQGSTFSFIFPVKDIKSKLADESPSFLAEEPTIKIPDLNNKKILVAEDDSSNYLFIESFLKRSGANILWARDGMQALEIFKAEHDIDLIIMDIRMPNLDGIEATGKIRKIDTKIPIIALTAYAFTNDQKKSLQAGCNDYLSKPVKLDILSETLNKFLKKPDKQIRK